MAGIVMTKMTIMTLSLTLTTMIAISKWPRLPFAYGCRCCRPLQLLEETLAMHAARGERGFVLDGFPRTAAQAAALQERISIDLAVNLSLREEVLVEKVMRLQPQQLLLVMLMVLVDGRMITVVITRLKMMLTTLVVVPLMSITRLLSLGVWPM